MTKTGHNQRKVTGKVTETKVEGRYKTMEYHETEGPSDTYPGK